MTRSPLIALCAIVALTFSYSACNCGRPVGVGPGPDSGQPDSGLPDSGPDSDAGLPGAGPGSACIAKGSTCGPSSATCCTGVCSDGGVCVDLAFCGAPGSSCTSGTECCTNFCAPNGQCSTQTCHDVGQQCSTGGSCCTGICDAGSCDVLPAAGGSSCGVLGQSCSTGAQCCSTNCQGGTCVRAYSCQANGDICFGNNDCCGHVCSVTDGGPGRCLFITGGGGGGCVQDGNPCSGSGTNCCSRLCVDPGSGATVCQPASGCRLTGDYCNSSESCCGGGTNPNGSVSCTNTRCDNGQMCQPVGNICGAAVLPDGGSINAPQDCCDGHQAVCKLDHSGIPRCFGGVDAGCPTGFTGQGGCCISTGNECQFSDQCCGGANCLPQALSDGGTHLTCQISTCGALGVSCAPDGGQSSCCTGTECLAATGGGFACAMPPAPDAGTQCKANGSACTSDAGTQCCSGICSNSQCVAPTNCQPLNGACTSTGDCCVGYSCTIPAGATSGTCQVGNSCPSVGQPCSPSTPCCSNLNCLNSAANPCTTATGCVCAGTIG